MAAGRVAQVLRPSAHWSLTHVVERATELRFEAPLPAPSPWRVLPDVATQLIAHRFADATIAVRLVGLTPRRFLRVARVHALPRERLADPARGWARLAAAHGYCDQSHLIDDCGALVGESPEAFLRRCIVE